MEANPVVDAEDIVDAAVASFLAALGGRAPAVSAVVPGAGAGGCGDDPLQRVVDGALEVLASVGRSEAKLAAVKVTAAGVLAGATRALNPPPASPYEASAQERSLVAEVGCVLAIGDRTAGRLLADAHALMTSLPRSLAALRAGTMSWAHAKTMVDQTVGLDPAAAEALEAHFLDPDAPGAARGCPIGQLPAYRFKAKARHWRERHHPESLEKRHARGVTDRRVEFWPDSDGMAWVAALLPADQASAICNRLTAIARGRQGPDEPRTLTQLKADTYTEALLTSGTTNSLNHRGTTSTGANAGGNGTAAGTGTGTGTGGGDGLGAGTGGGNGLDTGTEGGDGLGPGTDAGLSSGIRAQVLVTVPVFSLLGLTDEPAMLDGYGPIPPSMARKLVAEGAGSFYRVLVDPRDGAPLEIGRTTHRIGKAMRRWLSLRDGKCPFPGCNNPSLDNEADHLLAWANGGTSGVSNLGQPCPKHHKLRHSSGWKPTPASRTEPPGWTSPTGRHYKSEHQDWEPPHWPDSAVPTDIRELESLLERRSIPETPPEQWPPTHRVPEQWAPPEGPPGDGTPPKTLTRLSCIPKRTSRTAPTPSGSSPDTDRPKTPYRKTHGGQ